MSGLHVAYVSKSFPRSHWDLEYRAWHDSENKKTLDDRLALWAKRTDLKETSADCAFINVFFRETWGYVQTSQRGSETGFSLYLKFAIPGAGPNGGIGEADLAMDYFSKTAPGRIPQVLCEVKGIRSALDTGQKRQGNPRSPGTPMSRLFELCPARHDRVRADPWGIVTEGGGTFILAQWKALTTTFSITERMAGKKLCDALRKLATNDGSPVILAVMALERELASLDAEIAGQQGG